MEIGSTIGLRKTQSNQSAPTPRRAYAVLLTEAVGVRGRS